MSRYSKFLLGLLILAPAYAGAITIANVCTPAAVPSFTANATDKTLKVMCPGTVAPALTVANCSNPMVHHSVVPVTVASDAQYTVTVSDNSRYEVVCN
jgi:hypothetical protein